MFFVGVLWLVYLPLQAIEHFFNLAGNSQFSQLHWDKWIKLQQLNLPLTTIEPIQKDYFTLEIPSQE